MKIFFLVASLFFCNGVYANTIQEIDGALRVNTLYGVTTVTEPVLINLIKSPCFERLKQIHQYGVTPYCHKESPYTRYEHSLGVFFLTRYFGASLEEQIDALLHDASHTIFSHVGDYFFDHKGKKTSYQDEIHEWYLKQVGVLDLLHSYGFQNACSKQAKKRHYCLEQDKPDLCADRIDYNLEGALLDGLLTHEELIVILNSLHFKKGDWFFDDVNVAKKFAIASVKLSAQRWGAAWNVYLDYCATQALKRAVDLGLVTLHDIHFSTDDAVWNILRSNEDTELKVWVNRIIECEKSYVVDEHNYDVILMGKFSGTDPLIKTEQGLVRLSVLDSAYASYYAQIKESIAKGYRIQFIK